MIAKFLTVTVYLVLGGWIIILPLIIRLARGNPQLPYHRFMRQPYLAGCLLAGSAIWTAELDAAHDYKLALAWLMVAGLSAFTARKEWRQVALGTVAGMAVASAMPWWRHDLDFTRVSWHEASRYAAISTIALMLMARDFASVAGSQSPERWRRGAIAAFIPFALFFSFSTGITENPIIQIGWWHHWGAYVGPAELMRSAAHIFRDFAAQYGLGPTVLIAAACRDNCWLATYYIVGATTFLWSLLILTTVLRLNTNARGTLIVLPICTLIACFFWTSYGPAFSSPLLYPSVSGLRFLPVVALVALLCLIEGDLRWGPKWHWIGHIVWAVGALWSPESLYAVSFVWWPYYCWRRIAVHEWKKVPLVGAKAIARLVLVLLATLAGFVALYILAYRELPSLRGWLIYMLYPPGPLPINFKGPIWWYGATLILGLAKLVRIYRDQGDSRSFRLNLLVVLMGYAALSYCLGRAHDNNFVNLTPYALLILTGVFSSPLPIVFRSAAGAMLASIIGWMAVFGWSIWRDDYHAGRLFEFAPEKVIRSFSYSDPRTVARLKALSSNTPAKAGNPDDAARAIAQHAGESITVLDPYYLAADVGMPGGPWDAFRPTAIYPYMPQGWRTSFLTSTAQRLHKGGWVIADKTYFTALWLESYNAAYDLAGEEDYDTYHAYHFVPKSGE